MITHNTYICQYKVRKKQSRFTNSRVGFPKITYKSLHFQVKINTLKKEHTILLIAIRTICPDRSNLSGLCFNIEFYFQSSFLTLAENALLIITVATIIIPIIMNIPSIPIPI